MSIFTKLRALFAPAPEPEPATPALTPEENLRQAEAAMNLAHKAWAAWVRENLPSPVYTRRAIYGASQPSAIGDQLLRNYDESRRAFYDALKRAADAKKAKEQSWNANSLPS